MNVIGWRLGGAGLTAMLTLLLVAQSGVARGEEESDLFSNWRGQQDGPLLDVLGAEDHSAEDDRPRIPEPMVFDLVRPLGARRGEFEINALAIIPLNRRAGLSTIPDPVGLTPHGKHRTEWAPEIEFALFDGFAVEFELPFEDSTLEAYKFATQLTFGTAFERRYIHGAQSILLYDRHSGNWSPTLLYIGGLQFDERFSILGMAGVRTELNADDIAERTERLLNATLFCHINSHVTVGLESDFAHSLSGAADLLLMPQLHWEITDHTMLQTGVGVHFSKDHSLPQAAVRFIRSF